jgi:signal transduction histidine kinase
LDTSSLLIGGGAGALTAALASWKLLSRHVRRVRAAERRARAAERMAEIGAMTSGLAHEIKNPLSTIGMNAQLLLESIESLPISEGERSRLVSRAKALRREVDRLAGILADFLQFAGQMHLDCRPTDVHALLLELLEFYLPEAERHGVRVALHPYRGQPADVAALSSGSIESLGPPLIASIDVKGVKQALLNLILNAVQAMSQRTAAASSDPPATPTLTIGTDRSTDPDGRDMVHIIVADNGPGIAPEALPKIFDPYFTTRAGGSGLGLPTSRRIIEAHDGRIDVRSTPGQGATFTVIVPARADD